MRLARRARVLTLARAAALAGAALVVPAVLFGSIGAPAATGATPPAITVNPSPCSPRAANGGCSLAPETLAVTFPYAVLGTVGLSGVDVTWATTGRPAAAPAPASPTVFLSLGSAKCITATGSAPPTTCTWSWPAGLEATGSAVVLNGSYTVTPCTTTPTTTTTSPTTSSTTAPPGGAASGSTASGSTASVRTASLVRATATAAACTPAGDPAAAGFGVAASPGSPVDMRASAANSSSTSPVTVTWALSSEPDLAAYSVSRNGHVVYTCTLHGAVVAGAGACGPDPGFTDHPNVQGLITYDLVAERFGLNGAAPAEASPSTVASLTLGPPGTIASLPPIQVTGVPLTPAVVVPNTNTGGTSAAPTTTVPAPNGYGELPYGSQAHSAAALTGANASSTGSRDVNREALIAAGLLVLAIAAHLLYLKGAVARYQLVHGSAPPPAHAKPRPRLRLRWGGWPPITRTQPGVLEED